MSHPSNFLISLLLDLLDSLLREFLSMPHHVDFFATLRVRLQ
jgi:hypothetical protein